MIPLVSFFLQTGATGYNFKGVRKALGPTSYLSFHLIPLISLITTVALAKYHIFSNSSLFPLGF